jgi:hypothetical protein
LTSLTCIGNKSCSIQRQDDEELHLEKEQQYELREGDIIIFNKTHRFVLISSNKEAAINKTESVKLEEWLDKFKHPKDINSDELRLLEYKLLKYKVKRRGLEGNLFAAVADQLFESTDNATQVKSTALQWLRNNKDWILVTYLLC